MTSFQKQFLEHPQYRKELYEKMKIWRHDLHQIPELGLEEHKTKDYILAVLKKLPVDAIEEGWANTGLVVTIKGNRAGPRIGIRADMDALPLMEKGHHLHLSKHPGKMHACGHDGHVVMLLGAISLICEEKNFAGTVYCLFQPAEEGKGGARMMLEEGFQERYQLQSIFGLHNWPLLPIGKIAVRPGPIMAGSDRVEILIKGKGGHAAHPHHCIDPIIVAASVVSGLQNVISRQKDPHIPCVLSLTQIVGGTTDNIIPDEVYIQGSCRTFHHETQDFVEKAINNFCDGIAHCFGAKIDVTYTRGYPPTINDRIEAKKISELAKKLLGAENVIEDLPPSMGAEDFSYFLQKIPGCYFWLGTRPEGKSREEVFNIHHPEYDFNDDVLSFGSIFWYELVMK